MQKNPGVIQMHKGLLRELAFLKKGGEWLSAGLVKPEIG